MSKPALKNRHLAELHELAAELGIERRRMLGRDELIAAIREQDPEADGGGEEREEEPSGEPVEGLLDITPRGHGFIRLESGGDDVYVSPSQIRRCELERGDRVAGPARPPRRGERHPALVHVDKVNGAEPGGGRSRFGELTPVAPTRRLIIGTGAEGASEEETLLLRAVDLLCPLAFGQRVLVKAAPGAGRTTLMRALGRELAGREEVELVVLLIDERPEEETAWKEALGEAELAVAGAGMRSNEQLRVVELAVAQASRRAEAGADVVLLIDSLSRIAVAADDPSRAKPIFATGRETAEEDAGSLTVVATAIDTGAGAEVARSLETTENALITLERSLAEAGVYPALDVPGCRVSGEDSLREGPELAGARALRAELAGLPARDAAERLAERIGSAATNDTLLASLAE